MVTMMKKICLFVGLLSILLACPVYANVDSSAVSVGAVSGSFSATSGQKADIEFELFEPGVVTIEILEPDENVIRRIVGDDVYEPGKHILAWDGRDSAGNLVPNEVYTVRVVLKDKEGKLIAVAEPSAGTGGELLEVMNTELADNHIGFQISEPARVLVRIGIKDGPMLRNLLRWKPRTAGKNRVSWDGFDSSGVVDLRQDSKTTVMVAAHRLPDKSIIAYGNEEISYVNWFEDMKLEPKTVTPEEQALSRGDKRIAREYYRSVFQDREPQIELKIIQAGKALTEPYQLSESAVLRINADEASQWLLDESLYEVGFYVDGVFVSEEEQGYLPMSWRLNAKEYEAGDHVLTVNISGFDGRVGVASTVFSISE